MQKYSLSDYSINCQKLYNIANAASVMVLFHAERMLSGTDVTEYQKYIVVNGLWHAKNTLKFI